MRPTRLPSLLLTCAVAAVAAYLLARLVYGVLPPLPAYAPLTLALLAVTELLMARVVRQRMSAPLPVRARPMHPLQVARAAALAKASSPTGALLAGAYTGLLAHVLPLDAEQARDDALVAGLSAAAALALTGAALLLERACRTPPGPPPAPPAEPLPPGT